MSRIRLALALGTVVAAAGGVFAGPAGAAAPRQTPPPSPTLLPPLGQIVDGLLNSVGDTVEQVAGGFSVPATTGASPSTNAVGSPDVAFPVPEVPAGVEPPVTVADETPPPASSTPDDSGDGRGGFLPTPLREAVASKTNLLLLALGLGVALLGASPRLPAHRRARREVLNRLAAACERQRRAAQALAATDRSKGEFLGLVSHELRAPLTTMKGSVDTVLLDWERLPETGRRNLLTRASANADELARLVGELLDFARLDAGRIDIDVRALTVRDAVRDTVRGIEGIVAGHPVEIDIPDALVMHADTPTFAHVLGSLVANAAQCSPEGAPVRVAARARADVVVVSVTTTVPPDANGGSGIGLAVARRFAEVQGGRLWVDRSRRDSTCSFSVPAVPASAPAAVPA